MTPPLPPCGRRTVSNSLIYSRYEDSLRETMAQYSATPWKGSLTECEVFIGTILGQGQKQNKRQKEDSRTMRDGEIINPKLGRKKKKRGLTINVEFDKLVSYTISVIVDKESGGVESLERSVACFSAAIHGWDEEKGKGTFSSEAQHAEKLFSFPWIAAITCLQEVDKFQRSMPFA
jgi:hypothetical protein